MYSVTKKFPSFGHGTSPFCGLYSLPSTIKLRDSIVQQSTQKLWKSQILNISIYSNQYINSTVYLLKTISTKKFKDMQNQMNRTD